MMVFHPILFYLLSIFHSFPLVRSTETIFQCDHVFDSSSPRGEFSFPILPKRPTEENEVDYEQWEKHRNLQCIYTFVAGPGQRVKLDFDQFQLAGTADNCELEYVDIYSELERVQADLLSASLSGRYCGSVSPHVRISLHRVLVLVFHSRATNTNRRQLRFKGRYSFINENKYIPGIAIPGQKCSYIIDPNNNPAQKKRHFIISPTYPGTYPKDFHCSYLLKGKKGQRIRLFFRDFDLYFGGEHCPYDTLTVFDGSTVSSPIIRKVCGLQQRMEVFSVGSDLLIHFNTSNPSKADPRGFVIEYEFSSRFVDVAQLLGGQKGVTHRRGTECDVRVESNRETAHHIFSPNFPNLYPANTTCTYILDGLQGDQNLEKVILTFELFAIISDTSDNPVTVAELAEVASAEELQCPHAWMGVAASDANMRATLNSNDESNFEATLCERIAEGSPQMGPYISEGPRMVVQFGTTSFTPTDGGTPLGFKARVQFKTDFGVPGEPMGDSNQCLFRFKQPRGFFNSPRYPANYPLDTNCTYYIIGNAGEQILIHFEQFALFMETEEDKCKDWLEIFDVFREKDGGERLVLQARYCAGTFPGPRTTSFGSHEMRVVFSSDSMGSGNGFKALYEIRRALHDIPNTDEPSRCGHRIFSSPEFPTGHLRSPGFPVKYNKDVHCEWEVVARQGYQILLNLVKMEVEGAMADRSTPSCQKAVIRVSSGGGEQLEFCGTDPSIVNPILTPNNSVRISFLTAPDKVNGLKGFNFSWTEVQANSSDQFCPQDTHYLCTYSRLCISSMLRCNGDLNCGTTEQHDDTDESHCLKKENTADKTLIFAVIFCGSIFLFICGFFCFLFKKKLERKKKKKRGTNAANRLRQRQPYRSAKPAKTSVLSEAGLPSPATSRFVHHDATGILPPIALQPFMHQNNTADHHTFYG